VAPARRHLKWSSDTPTCGVKHEFARVMWRFGMAALVAAFIVWAAQPSPNLRILNLRPSPLTRLLVIAPHPDDETIAAAGVMQRVRSAGGRVRVVLITSGDAFPPALEQANPSGSAGPDDFKRFGRVRENESRRGLLALGLHQDDVTFLGFPDEGVCLLASAFLSARSRPLTSPYTERAMPPRDEQVVRGVSYRGSDVRLELERIVKAFAPTVIMLPDPQDEHPDHCASYIFGRSVLDRASQDRSGSRPRLLRYVIHFDDWPSDRATATPIMPPSGFDEPSHEWRTFPLTTREARNKKTALSAYTTQWPVVGPLLRGFTRSNELFLEGEPAHPPECWCDAEHVATELAPSQRRRPPRTTAR
jgi:LmbE family N-acetylglucosaminyl deacetylase